MKLEQLLAIMPHLASPKASLYLPFLNAAMDEGQVNTPARMAAFIAQLAHESGELRYLEELASGKEYDISVNPRLAQELGNTSPGDGEKYKGRGPIQITGKDNYGRCGRALGLDLVNNPELLARPRDGFRAAVWFWNTRHLNELADQDTATAFESITKHINGGLNGEDDRLAYWRRARQAMGLS